MPQFMFAQGQLKHNLLQWRENPQCEGFIVRDNEGITGNIVYKHLLCLKAITGVSTNVCNNFVFTIENTILRSQQTF